MEKQKRSIIVVWCVTVLCVVSAILLGLLVPPSYADTEPVIGVLDKPEHFVISADGDLTAISAAGKAIANNCDELHLNIPEGVKVISKELQLLYDSPFYEYHKKITAVTLPESLTTIHFGAFYECTALTSIDIPKSVTSILNGAFEYCPLTSIDLSRTAVTTIEFMAFYACRALTSIELPASLTSIGANAFFNCTALTSIELPASLTSIETSAFQNCTSLTSIKLPAGLTSVGNTSFTKTVSLVCPDQATYEEYKNGILKDYANQLTYEVPHEHAYTETERKEPTCGADGWVKYECSCGDSYTETIPATGEHSYGAWTTVIEPTTTTAGEEKRVCSVCGHSETRAIPKLPDPTDPTDPTQPTEPTKPQIKAPTALTQEFIYNGKEQIYLPDGFDPNTMTITDNQRKTVGTQTVTVTLNDPDAVFVDTETNAVEFDFTINQAQIIVRKNGNEWFDERVAGDLTADWKISFLDRDADGKYKYIITVDDCELQIGFYARLCDEGESVSGIQYPATVPPKIPQNTPKGRYEIHYQITDPAGNHARLASVWRVEIADKDDYLIVIFNRPFTVSYGMDYLAQLKNYIFDPNAQYLTVYDSGVAMPLAEFAELVDVHVTAKHPNAFGHQNSGTYDIYFTYKPDATENRTMIYRDSNAGYDTNEDMLVIKKAELDIKWGKMEQTYTDGATYDVVAELSGHSNFVERDLLQIRLVIRDVDGRIVDQITAPGSYLVEAYLVDDLGNFVIAESAHSRVFVVKAAVSGFLGISWWVWTGFALVVIFIILLILIYFTRKKVTSNKEERS